MQSSSAVFLPLNKYSTAVFLPLNRFSTAVCLPLHVFKEPLPPRHLRLLPLCFSLSVMPPAGLSGCPLWPGIGSHGAPLAGCPGHWDAAACFGPPLGALPRAVLPGPVVVERRDSGLLHGRPLARHPESLLVQLPAPGDRRAPRGRPGGLSPVASARQRDRNDVADLRRNRSTARGGEVAHRRDARRDQGRGLPRHLLARRVIFAVGRPLQCE